MSFSVEEVIGNLNGKYLERYKKITEWKTKRGIKDPYAHVKLKHDIPQNEENSEQKIEDSVTKKHKSG